MIEKLTKEQEALLPEFRDKWLDIGLCTDEADYGAAIEAAKDCYKRAGLTPPPDNKFYTAVSPKQACIFAAMLSRGADPRKEEPTEEDFKNYRNHLNDCVFGNHDASWLCFYDYFYEVFKLDFIEQLLGLISMSKVSGWWLPYDDCCIISDRHSELHRDDQFRLHNETGAAVKYRDGWSVYSMGGVRMPEGKYIDDPSTLTVDVIKEERNAEVRRNYVTIYGQERYFEDAGAKMIHKDDHGELYEIEQDGDENIKFVKVINSTPEPDGTYKNYHLRVDPSMERAKQAIAWTFRKTEEEYDLAQQT